MKRIKARFLLPAKANDGRDLSTEITEVEDRVYAAFGGWTQEGYFKGTWRMETGQRQTETNIVYFVVIPEEQLAQLETILKDFKKKAGQEAVYLEIERDVDVRLL